MALYNVLDAIYFSLLYTFSPALPPPQHYIAKNTPLKHGSIYESALGLENLVVPSAARGGDPVSLRFFADLKHKGLLKFLTL